VLGCSPCRIDARPTTRDGEPLASRQGTGHDAIFIRRFSPLRARRRADRKFLFPFSGEEAATCWMPRSSRGMTTEGAVGAFTDSLVIARSDSDEIRCHRPRKRAIQYSRGRSRLRRGRGVLEAPVKPGHDDGGSGWIPRKPIRQCRAQPANVMPITENELKARSNSAIHVRRILRMRQFQGDHYDRPGFR
jgi:hypothetical protein